MITIHKYPVLTDRAVMVPRHFIALDVQYQGGEPYLWAMVDTEQDPGPVRFKVYGTGHEIDKSDLATMRYIKTIQMGFFVWHVFAGDGDPCVGQEPGVLGKP